VTVVGLLRQVHFDEMKSHLRFSRASGSTVHLIERLSREAQRKARPLPLPRPLDSEDVRTAADVLRRIWNAH